MKILIVSQHFWPETFRINDLASELNKKGYDVEVLTGKPNYPSGNYFKGYGFFSHNNDLLNNIKIHRVPLIARGNGNIFRLSLNYLSFVFFASLFVLFNRKKYDYTITFASSPIIQALPSLLHKKLYKSKALLWVQDLWPESVIAIYGIKKGLIYRILGKTVDFIYKHSDKIMVQSEAFKEVVYKRCTDKEKVVYLPNWAEELFIDQSTVEKHKFIDLFPVGFKIMFAGNIGEAQDFESIIKAAYLTKSNKDIKWIIVGDGRKKSWAEAEVKRLGLQETFYFIGKFPLEEMPHMFIHSDIMLITLKDEYIFSLTIPSKIQTYMAFGKPIIGMLNGISGQIITNADCGYVTHAGDYKDLANKVLNAFEEKRETLDEYGKNAKKYYLNNFSKEQVLLTLQKLFIPERY